MRIYWPNGDGGGVEAHRKRKKVLFVMTRNG